MPYSIFSGRAPHSAPYSPRLQRLRDVRGVQHFDEGKTVTVPRGSAVSTNWNTGGPPRRHTTAWPPCRSPGVTKSRGFKDEASKTVVPSKRWGKAMFQLGICPNKQPRRQPRYTSGKLPTEGRSPRRSNERFQPKQTRALCLEVVLPVRTGNSFVRSSFKRSLNAPRRPRCTLAPVYVGPENGPLTSTERHF